MEKEANANKMLPQELHFAQQCFLMPLKIVKGN